MNDNDDDDRERTQLLDRLRKVCWNDEDYIDLVKWKELRTVLLKKIVGILDDGGIEVISQISENRLSTMIDDEKKSHCYIPGKLFQWVAHNPDATHPITRQPINPPFRTEIMEALALVGPNTVRSYQRDLLSYVFGEAFMTLNEAQAETIMHDYQDVMEMYEMGKLDDGAYEYFAYKRVRDFHDELQARMAQEGYPEIQMH